MISPSLAVTPASTISTGTGGASDSGSAGDSGGGGSFGATMRPDNPTPHRLPEGENATPLEVIGTTASDKLIVIMVGLPATGAYARLLLLSFLQMFVCIVPCLHSYCKYSYKRGDCKQNLTATRFQ
jgi:hypothetical protein